MTSSASSEALDSLIDPGSGLERLATGFLFTEGPAWSAAEQALYFTDIPADSRWRWSEAAGATQIMKPTFKANGQAFDRDGNLVVCEHISNSVVRIGPSGRREVLAYQYRGRYLNSPNDLVVRATDGSIYFTDPDYGRVEDYTGLERPRDLEYQGLYRIDPDGGLELMCSEDEFIGPNGLCFSPDESRLYVNDTDRACIKTWEVEPSGRLVNGRMFAGDVAEPSMTGAVDGMECDELGNVWVAALPGVWVFNPLGAKLGIIEVPEPVGSLVWGGRDLRSLFIAGSTSLYRMQTRVAGTKLPGNH
jgi:gluconolactonase